jgi:hypothetical protein
VPYTLELSVVVQLVERDPATMASRGSRDIRASFPLPSETPVELIGCPSGSCAVALVNSAAGQALRTLDFPSMEPRSYCALHPTPAGKLAFDSLEQFAYVPNRATAGTPQGVIRIELRSGDCDLLPLTSQSWPVGVLPSGAHEVLLFGLEGTAAMVSDLGQAADGTLSTPFQSPLAALGTARGAWFSPGERTVFLSLGGAYLEIVPFGSAALRRLPLAAQNDLQSANRRWLWSDNGVVDLLSGSIARNLPTDPNPLAVSGSAFIVRVAATQLTFALAQIRE